MGDQAPGRDERAISLSWQTPGDPQPVVEEVILGEGLPTISIGRASRNTVQISQPGVSREHARLRLDAGQLIVEDLGSHNKTWRKRADEVTIAPFAVRPGDVVMVGAVAVTVTYDEELTETATVSQTARVGLTATEQSIVEQINSCGVEVTNREIANQRFITEKVVEKHLASIADKLGVLDGKRGSRKADIINVVRLRGLVARPDPRD